MFRTLESEIGLYETDYIFVSSGYPPRVKVGWTSWIFLRSQLPGLTGFVSAPALSLRIFTKVILNLCLVQQFDGFLVLGRSI